jgi:conjugal transfer pilus assembly protein TraF
MRKGLSLALLCFLGLLPIMSFATDPIGWHWYDLPAKQSDPKDKNHKTETMVSEAFNAMTPLQQMQTLQYILQNEMDKAILTGNVNDISDYKQMQDFFVDKATNFSVGWSHMLTLHPELNYALQHPTSNQLAHDEDSKLKAQEASAADIIGRQYGFLFFYHGSHSEDTIYNTIVQRFTGEHHITTKMIDVDGSANAARASQLGIRYFPAIMLFDPKTHAHTIFRYGFGVDSDLAQQSYAIVSNWNPEF